MQISIIIRTDMVGLAPYTVTRCNRREKVYVLRRRLRSAPFILSHVRQIELATDNTPKTIAFYKSMGLREMSEIGCCGFLKL